jgi:hypothetical protein
MAKVLEMKSLCAPLIHQLTQEQLEYMFTFYSSVQKNRTDRQRIRIDDWNHYFGVTNAILAIERI